MSGLERNMRRADRRAAVRKEASWQVRATIDRQTGELVRAVLVGTVVRGPFGGAYLVPSQPSRQAERGGRFSAWLEAELADRPRRHGRRKKNRRERRARRLR